MPFSNDADIAAKQLFQKSLPQTRSLGMAIGQGDCFYDAIAQALNEQQHTQRGGKVYFLQQGTGLGNG